MKNSIKNLKNSIRESRLDDEYIAYLKTVSDEELEILADEVAKSRNPASKHELALIQRVINNRKDFRDISYHSDHLFDDPKYYETIYESKRNELKLLKRSIREALYKIR